MKILQPRKAYFTKLFVTMLSVFLSMAFVITAFLYSSNHKMITKEREVVNEFRIAAHKLNTDNQLNIAVSQIELYRNDAEFAEYAVSGGSDKSMKAKIYDRLNRNQFVFNNLGVCFGIINPKTQDCIMSDSFNKLDVSKLNIQYDSLSLTNYNFINTYGKIPMTDGRDKEGAVFTIMQKYSGEYDLVFVFLLYNINSLSVNDTDNYIVAYDNSLVFTSRDTELVDSVLKVKGEEEKIKDVNVYQLPSNVLPQIRYYYCANRQSSMLMLQTIGIFLLLLAIGIVLTFFIVKKLYDPIGKVLRDLHKINKDDYLDEIEYVSQTANKMYENIAQLKERDKKQLGLIQKKFLHDLCIGIVTNEEARQFINEYSLDLLMGKNFVVNVEIIRLGQDFNNLDEDVYKNVKNDLIEMFVTNVLKGETYYLIQPSNARFAFIVCGNIQAYIDRINSLFRSIEYEYEIDMIAAIGCEAQDYMQTEKSYRDTVSILDNYFFPGDTYVSMRQNVEDNNEIGLYYPLEIEQQIIEHMIHSKLVSANNLLEKVLNINIENGITTQKWKELKFLLMSTINRIISHMNQSIESIFGEDAVLYLELTSNKSEDQKEKIKEVFRKLGEYVSNTETAKGGQLKKIVEFIDQNIDKDISLMVMAEHLNLSPSYVSKLFKNVVKQNFKIYVNIRRVEAAKRILSEEKNIRINDLAVRVGCNNTVTFTRIFKKYTGMTPSEFN